MAHASVLIVGAGALGVVTGYHLGLAGAEIAFLVRPDRLANLRDGQTLYCFDDHLLKRFSDYNSFTTVAEAMATPRDFVIITMDGATCRSEEATQLLTELGKAMQGTDTVAVISGLGVLEYCRQTMGLPEDRIIFGTMGLLSYQTDRVTLPRHPPTDADRLASADIGYRHMGENPGFMLTGSPEPTKAFADLYNACGVSKCAVMKEKLFAAYASSIFVTMAIFDLAGWPTADRLAEDKELMRLGSRATKEVMRLPEHGAPGKILALLNSPRQMAKSNRKMEQMCRPVDYSAFNRFHHGGKVREQDIEYLRECYRSGSRQGRSMPALRDLIDRYERHIAA